jgi:hypothetical protein
LARLLAQDEWIEPFLEPTPADDPKPPQPTCIRRILERLGKHKGEEGEYTTCAAFGDELELMWQSYVDTHGALHPISRQAVRLCYLTREVFFDELQEHTTAHQRELDHQESKRRVKKHSSSPREVSSTPQSIQPVPPLPKLSHLPPLAPANATPRKRPAPTSAPPAAATKPEPVSHKKRKAILVTAAPPPIEDDDLDIARLPTPVVLAPLDITPTLYLSDEQRAQLVQRARKVKTSVPVAAPTTIEVLSHSPPTSSVRITPAQQMNMWAEQYAEWNKRAPATSMPKAVEEEKSVIEDDEGQTDSIETIYIPSHLPEVSPVTLLGHDTIPPPDSHYITTTKLVPGSLQRTIVLLGAKTDPIQHTHLLLESLTCKPPPPPPPHTGAHLALQQLSRHFHLADLHQATTSDWQRLQLPELPTSERVQLRAMQTRHHSLSSLSWLPRVDAYCKMMHVRVTLPKRCEDYATQSDTHYVCRALFLYHVPNTLVVLPQGTRASFPGE